MDANLLPFYYIDDTHKNSPRYKTQVVMMEEQ